MKRTLSLCLTFLLLFGILAPVGQAAVDPLAPSEELITLLKRLEGYRSEAYVFNNKWAIGYGTSCEKDEYPDGIDEEQAEILLREDVDTAVDTVNNFLRKYNIVLQQHQFDALCSFTYNLGTQWIDPDYRFASHLIRGINNYTQDEIVCDIAMWCHIDGQPSPGMIKRRMAEACLFTTGSYTDEDFGDQYVYLRHDPSGGSIPYSLLFFPKGQPYGNMQIPQNTDEKTFQGWYTSDGTAVTAQSVAQSNLQVYARWGDVVEPDPWENPYADLAEDQWYFGYVRDLSILGIVNGYEDQTFRPDRTLSAGEALKLTILAADHPIQQPLEGGHWASGYLDYAQAQGWLEEGEVTDLDAPITRLLVAKLAAQAMYLPESSTVTPFADTQDPYVLSLYDAKIVEGDKADGVFLYRPEDDLLRSHICAIVWRIQRYEATERPLSPEELGYIPYRDHEVPLLSSVPKCLRDPDLYTMDSRKWIKYNDPGAYTAIGIDISAYQKEVDWRAVKQDGVEFVFLRLAFRGYTAGTLNLDSYFLQNLRDAKEAGLKVGAYVFSTAISVQEAMEEAAFALETLAGEPLDMPLVFDWEANNSRYRNYDLDTKTLNNCATAFCEAVKAAGYTPMIYFNMPAGYLKYDLSGLTRYDFWFAQYSNKPTMYYDYQIWQYSDSGSVNGVEGRVDMNIAFKRFG